MLLERIYDEDLAHASYLIGCQADGSAVVVDPRRDIEVYLDLAQKRGLRITAVAETHIHADFLSGTRELAARTGARMHVSDEGGPDWTYGDGFEDAVRMRDGHELTLGSIALRALHTPGHTPEHMSYLITDGAQADRPGYLLSGDFVFVGDVGRPDLLDEAAGGVDTRFQGAKDLFASLRDRFLALPDYVQVLPAHGAGSACGKALGAVPSSTVGYERAFSWWAPFLASDDEDGFVAALLDGQPDAHAYFGRMKRQNRSGPALLGPLPALERRGADDLARRHAEGAEVLLDVRPHAEVRRGTLPGALTVPGAGKAASFGAWVYDPERESTPITILADSEEAADEVRAHLLRVGIDTARAWVAELPQKALKAPRVISREQLDELEPALVLDVRTRNEHAEGHVPGSRQLSGGRALWRQDELPREGLIVTYCRSDARSAVTASALRRAGFDVAELDGSMSGWEAAGRPVER